MARDGFVGRALDYAEDQFGFRVVEGSHLHALEEAAERLGFFIDEASELGYQVLDHFAGRPNEMRPERRNRLAQRSRRALREDPLASADASLLANFALGRGVAKPECADPRVQEVVDEAWTDPVNLRKLTSFEAQRHRSNQLRTDANLFPTGFVRNGRVRLGFIEPDLIADVVVSEEDDELPLFYVGRKPKLRWNFERHEYEDDEGLEGGMPRVVYWQHWRHVEDAQREADDDPEAKAPKLPDAKVLQPGLVEHVRINRIGRTQFGTPPWAATLRFFSAMNVLTEAHVAMAQARSTWIAKQTVRGGPRAVVDAANSLLNQTGEISSARFGVGEPPRDLARPPMPGSVATENESLKLESLNLSSGAGEAATTAQIVRAPIAAAIQFGQHYIGDAGNANLATATSLELPALMNVEAWQEVLEGMLRWFVDLVIQEAARAGRFGGMADVLTESDEEWLGRERTRAEKLPLSKLRLTEDDERRELERRTGMDLSYSFEMPYPGRRNLPDVVTAVTTLSSAFDPAGQNVPLRRAMLLFFARDGLQVADPQHWVDEILPEGLMMLPGATPPTDEEGNPIGAPPLPPVSKGGPSGGATPSDERSQYGERTGNARRGAREMAESALDAESLRVIADVERDLDAEWKRLVTDPAVVAAIAASAGARNGTP